MRSSVFEALRECASALQSGNLSLANYYLEFVLNIVDKDTYESSSSHSFEKKLTKYFAELLARRAYGLFPKYLISLDYKLRKNTVRRFHILDIANSAIEEAIIKGRSNVHVIYLSQYGIPRKEWLLMRFEQLCKSGVPNPYFKLSIIVTSSCCEDSFRESAVKSLVETAKTKSVTFEFSKIEINRYDEIDVSCLNMKRDEFVVVNSYFVLGDMLSEPTNMKLLLGKLRELIKPDIMMIAEYDGNRNRGDFLQRFDNALQYYAHFNFLEYEQICNVACEGVAGQYMSPDQWRNLLTKSGFSSIPLLPCYDNVKRHRADGLLLEWKNEFLLIHDSSYRHWRPLSFVLAWKLSLNEVSDFDPISLNEDYSQNKPISPQPQHASLIKMGYSAEIHDIPRDILNNQAVYFIEFALTWATCSVNNLRSSLTQPCLCIVDTIGAAGELENLPFKVIRDDSYHLQADSLVNKAFESNQPVFKPHTNENDIPYLIGKSWKSLINGAFAIKLRSLHTGFEDYVVEFLFCFPDNWRLEQRRKVVDSLLCDLKHKQSYFFTYGTQDNSTLKLSDTREKELIRPKRYLDLNKEISNDSRLNDLEAVSSDSNVQRPPQVEKRKKIISKLEPFTSKASQHLSQPTASNFEITSTSQSISIGKKPTRDDWLKIFDLKYGSPNFAMNELMRKTVTKQHTGQGLSQPKSIALDLGNCLQHVEQGKNVRDYLIHPFTSRDLNLLEKWRNRKLTGETVIRIETWDINDRSLAPLVRLLDNISMINTPREFFIDDTVINAYFYLLKKRHDIYPNMCLKHYSFSSFIASKLFSKQAEDLSNQFDLEDLVGAQKLFLPVSFPDSSHWVLFCVDIKDRQLLWLDSYGVSKISYRREMREITEWFSGYLLPSLGCKDASNWEVKVREDIPTQQNAIDCGIFVMKYADCLTHGDYFPFSQADMPHFRKRIFLDIFSWNIHVPQEIKRN